MDTIETATTIHPSRPSKGAGKLLLSIIVFLVGALFGVATVIFMAYYTTPDLTKYAGDGEADWIGTPIISPGYKIEFAAFDMSQSFSKEFRFAGLPESRGDASFFVKVLSLTPVEFYGSGTPASQPTGSLRLRLQEGDAGPIFDVSGPVTGYRGEDSNTGFGGLYEYYLYFDDPVTYINPNSLKPETVLTFRIEYEPGEAPIRGFGVPIIRVGGSL